MNLLYDALPDTVTVDGKAYRIYTDYRDWLRFYDMQEDDGLSKREKLLLMLEWYIDKPPLSCLEEALEASHRVCDTLRGAAGTAAGAFRTQNHRPGAVMAV